MKKESNKSEIQNSKILKKTKNEPEHAKENLDVPGGRTARPLTNDRHQISTKPADKSEKEPIENIELDTEPGKKK